MIDCISFWDNCLIADLCFVWPTVLLDCNPAALRLLRPPSFWSLVPILLFLLLLCPLFAVCVRQRNVWHLFWNARCPLHVPNSLISPVSRLVQCFFCCRRRRRCHFSFGFCFVSLRFMLAAFSRHRLHVWPMSTICFAVVVVVNIPYVERQHSET